MAQSSWRTHGVGVVRILFGLVWLADAWFKWQPDFINKFMDYITETLKDQSAVVQAWLSFWVNVMNVNPQAFAVAVAVGETAIALGLILGVLSNLTNIGGALLAIVIWSTAEGFGGPYQAGSTDVGAAIIYALVHAVLFLTRAGDSIGFDRWLTPKLKGWGILATGPRRTAA